MADGDVFLTPAEPDTPHPLGRAGVAHKPANRLFPASVMPRTTATPRKIPWGRTAVFDQGSAPSCTAQAAVGLCETQPYRIPFKPHRPAYDDYGERHALYLEAQKHDPWPGESYDGSSGDAPLTVLRDRGVIVGWRWLFGLTEVREHLSFKGPVSAGTWWRHSMFTVDARGYVVVDDAGGNAGGHQYDLVFYSPTRMAYRIVNSWGRGWGEEGRAWIAEADLERLLNEQGDAVVIG